jgi:hypothetical protein
MSVWVPMTSPAFNKGGRVVGSLFDLALGRSQEKRGEPLKSWEDNVRIGLELRS